MITFILVIHVVACVLMATPSRASCLDESLHIVMLNESYFFHRLDEFSEEMLCLRVNVTHSHPHSCYWSINDTQAGSDRHRDYVLHADESSIVLHPFGPYFHYTNITCHLSTSSLAYRVSIGRLHAGKWNEHMGSREEGKIRL